MKNAILLLCFVLAAERFQAQSYHFSQFFSTPLLTNPANTGFTDGPYRFATNMRSQGIAGGGSFFTGYLSAEFSPLRDKLPLGHKAGLGIYLMNDHSLTSVVRTNAVGFSAAYNVGLDTYGEHSIGLGVQGVYHQRRIDYSKLTFENQFGAAGFDPSLSVGEPLDVNSKQFFDLNAGINYNRVVENKAFFAGLSMYNILAHRDNLLTEEFKMPLRILFQAGTQISMAPQGNVYLSLTTMHQAKATELTLGGAYGVSLSDEDKNELMGGLWYRFKDAVIPYFGYQRNNFQVGFSYDYTVSAQKTGATTRNAYELTLIYKSIDVRELKTVIPWY